MNKHNTYKKLKEWLDSCGLMFPEIQPWQAAIINGLSESKELSFHKHKGKPWLIEYNIFDDTSTQSAHIDMFDLMYCKGYKLNLITGVYYK